MGSALRAAVAFCLLLAGLWLCAGPARACNVPVFRYALERWPAAPYEVFVFHRGPLSAEDQAALEHLKKLGRADSGEGCINLCVADLGGTPDAYARKIRDAALSGQPSAIPVVDPPPVAGLAAFAAEPKTPSRSVIAWTTSAIIRRAVAAIIVGFALLTVIVLAWRKKRPKNN